MNINFTRRPYRGDFGMVLNADVGFPTKEALEAMLILQKPSGTVVELEALPEGESAVALQVAEGVLDEAGAYKAQVRVVIGEWTGHSDIGSFDILQPLEVPPAAAAE